MADHLNKIGKGRHIYQSLFQPLIQENVRRHCQNQVTRESSFSPQLSTEKLLLMIGVIEGGPHFPPQVIGPII